MLQNLSLQKYMGIIFAFILLLTITALSIAVLHIQEKQINTLIAGKLQDSTNNVIERMSILRSTVDSREYDKKLSYFLSQQRSSYQEQALGLNQYLIQVDNKEITRFGELSDFPVNETLLNQIIAEQKGITMSTFKDHAYIISYAFSLESNTLVALVMPKSDYLKPLNNLRNFMFIIAAISLILSCLATWLISNYITQPITYLVGALKKVESGYLNTSIPEKQATSELSHMSKSFNSMISYLAKFTAYLSNTVSLLKHSSSDLQNNTKLIQQEANAIVLNIENINQETNQQLNDIKAMCNSVNELTNINGTIEKQKQEAIKTSTMVFEQSQTGQTSITEMLAKLNSLNNIAGDTSHSFSSLENKLQEVLKINTSIEEIAQKIKLVALNATLEAARAGIHGNAFSIVAYEVTNLAQNTHDFSLQTNKIVQEIFSRFKVLDENYNNICQEISLTLDISHEAGRLFNGINNEIILNQEVTEQLGASINSNIHLLQTLNRQIDNVWQKANLINHAIPPMLNSARIQENNCNSTQIYSSELLDLSAQIESFINKVRLDSGGVKTTS